MAELLSHPPLPYDAELLHEQVGGDPDLLREIVALFLDDSPRLLGEIRGAAVTGDVDRLMRAAHTLKGSASNFGACELMEAALALETMGRGGDVAGAGPQAVRLEAALGRLNAALAGLLDDTPA